MSVLGEPLRKHEEGNKGLRSFPTKTHTGIPSSVHVVHIYHERRNWSHTMAQASGDTNTVTGDELSANISNYHLLCLQPRHKSVGRRTKRHCGAKHLKPKRDKRYA